jgi:hypothetical protein
MVGWSDGKPWSLRLAPLYKLSFSKLPITDGSISGSSYDRTHLVPRLRCEDRDVIFIDTALRPEFRWWRTEIGTQRSSCLNLHMNERSAR